MFENSVNIMGRTKTTVATGTASQVEPGVYDVWGESDIHVAVNKNNTVTVNSSTGYLIRSGTTVPVRVAENGYIIAAGTGNYYFMKVD